MSEHLFLYGTLLPEHAPAELARVVSRLHPVGGGSIGGVLYDLGNYPGAVLNSWSRKRIYGTVFRLPDDPAVLNELDVYEGFEPTFPERSLFNRRRCCARLSSGRTLVCWIYEYNRRHQHAAILSGGRYRTKAARSTADAGQGAR